MLEGIDKEIYKAVILDIILESSKWRLSEGDDRDPIRIQVEHEAKVLFGVIPGEMDQSGMVHDFPTPVKPMKDYSHPNRVRVSLPGGKKKWVTPDKVKKVPYARSKTGFRYVLKEDADVAEN